MAAEQTLRVLRAQAGVELGDAAKAFADVAARHAVADGAVRQAEASHQAAGDEMRRLAAAPAIHLAAYEMVRRVNREARARVDGARSVRTQAEAELDQARAELGRLRQLDSGLGRAIDAQRHLAAQAREAATQAVIDDLWLQAYWSAR